MYRRIMSRPSRRRRAAATVCGFLILGTACSPTTSTDTSDDEPAEATIQMVIDEVQGLDGAERTERLQEMAQEEGGELSLYTSLSSEVEDELAGAFEDSFEIDVSVFRADSESILQRLREESRASFEGADVVETTAVELVALEAEDILAHYESPEVDRLIEGAQHEGWTIDRFNNFVVSWNTEDVAPDEVPQAWEDLAEDEWEGRLAMEPTDVGWFKGLWDHWVAEGRSEEEVQELFERMSRNALFIKGHTTTGTLLAAGEFSVAASNYSYLVEASKATGAPVEWKPPVEPIFSLPFGVAPIRNTPRPATALLFTDWLLSDGQEVLQELQLDPAREDLSATADIEQIIVELGSPDEMDTWNDRYEELTKLGETIPEG